jgi:hypothetical protein
MRKPFWSWTNFFARLGVPRAIKTRSLRHPQRRRLQFEPLELRVLLAGDLGLDTLDPYLPGEEPPGIVAQPPKLSINDVAVVEGDMAMFTVALDSPSDQPVTVRYQTENATATAESRDYQCQCGVLTFAPGQTSRRIAILTGSDPIYEHDEHFWVSLSDASGAVIEAGKGVGGILDNDIAPQISILGCPLLPSEAAEFIVSLSNPYEKEVAVDYATVDGTARAGKDYQAAAETITFLPGETVKTISVPTITRGAHAEEKAFSVVLSNPQNAELAMATAEGTIAPRLGPTQKQGDLLSGGGDVMPMSAGMTSVSISTNEGAFEDGEVKSQLQHSRLARTSAGVR